jgi:ferrous iron transport protein A
MTQSEVRFADLKVGDRARVVEIDSSDHSALRLLDLGLTIGTVFVVLKVAPFGDPIEIEFRGTRLCLRRREAQAVRVEVVDSE